MSKILIQSRARQVVAAAAAANMVPSMTTEFAVETVARCLARARELDTQMCIAVVDITGRLKAFVRDDGAWLGSIQIAQAKAFTALGFSGDQAAQGPLTTEDLGKEAFDGGTLQGITDTNLNDGVVAFAGGIPLYVDDQLVGAVGVSGSTVDNDQAVAEAGAETEATDKEQS